MANEIPVETNESESIGSQQSKSKDKSMLEYTLKTLPGRNVIFSLHYQHPYITRFLAKGPFISTDGVQVMLGFDFPEWVISSGVIKLDGTEGECLNRPDNSIFGSDYIMNTSIRKFHTALAELVNAVREAYQTTDEAPKVADRFKL